MAELVRLDDFKRRRSFVHFTRQELNQLLQIYSGRVASGDWRDYAIHHDTTRARFIVFRSRLEGPTYTVVKWAPERDGKGSYLVAQGARPLRRGNSLAEVLSVFARRLTLVSSGS
jgi:hypothetical protein